MNENEESDERTPEKGYRSYEFTRGFDFLTFGWFTKWSKTVAYENLDFEHYPAVPRREFDTFAATELSLYLKECKLKKRGPLFEKLLGYLRLSILRVFKYSFAYLFVLTVVKDIMEIMIIHLLQNALNNVSLNGIASVISYLCLIVLHLGIITFDIFLDGYHHFYNRRLAIRVEMTLHMLLFGKILTKNDYSKGIPSVKDGNKVKAGESGPSTSKELPDPSSDRAYLDEASILNLALFDVYEVSSGIVRIIDLINVPVKILLLGLWMYEQIGPVAIHALLILMTTTIIMIMCECQCAVLLKDYVTQMDLRLFKTQIVLEDVKELRLMKWLGYAMESVAVSRIHELQLCLKRAYLGAISNWVGMASPYIMSLAIFLISARTESPILRGMNLDKGRSIPLIHALSYFIQPFKKLPSHINDHLETALSCRRLEEYIYKRVLDFHIPTIYDKQSVKAADPNLDRHNPYQVDYSALDTDSMNAIYTFGKKTSSRLPLWMLKKKEKAKHLAAARNVTRLKQYKWGLMNTKSTTFDDGDIRRDTYMGVSYPHVVKLGFATFKSGNHTVLSNISLTLFPNQVCLITGPSGSGKTSLLNALLGQYQLTSGVFTVVPLEVNLPIGYVSQDPWIQVGSVRECILFGHAMDATLYNKIVNAVGLDIDFNSWDMGDLRLVDEGGQNLSTGQRMRISIARCLYNQLKSYSNVHAMSYTLYCLDNIFSVLDPTLSAKIFNALFGEDGLLKGACVVMVIQDEFVDMVRYHGLNLSYMSFSVYHMKGLILDPYGESIENFMARQADKPMKPKPSEAFLSQLTVTSVVDDDNVAIGETNLNDTNQSRGSIRVETFIWFFNNVGMTIVVASLTLSFLSVMVTIVYDQVVRSWGKLVDKINGKTPNKELLHILENVMLKTESYDARMKLKLNHYYLLIFLISTKIIMCLFTSLIETIGAIQSARNTFHSALKGILRSPISVFNSLRIGVINNRLTTDQSYVDYSVFYRFSHISSVLIYCLMSIISLSILNWWSGLTLPFVLIAIYLAVVRHYLPMCRENMRAILGTRAALCTVISQTIYGSTVIRAARRETTSMTQFLRYLESHHRVKFFSASAVAWSNIRLRLLTLPIVVVNLISPLIQLVLIGTGIGSTAMDANVAMALSYSLKVSKTLKSVLSLMIDLTNNMCAVQRLQDMSKMQPNYDARMEQLNIFCRDLHNYDYGDSTTLDEVCFPEERTGVTVRDIVVDYDFNMKSAEMEGMCAQEWLENRRFLKRQSSMECEYLYCPPGEHVGIVGRTGSGKSTLMSALAGTIQLVNGNVQLDGVDIISIAADESLDIIGNIPHNPPLLVHWTIRHYVDPRHRHDDSEIWKALFDCSIGSYVKSLPGDNPLDIVIKKSWQSKCKAGSSQSDNIMSEGLQIQDVTLQYLTLARLLLYKEHLRMILVDEPFLVGKGDKQPMTPIHELVHRHFRDCNVFLVAHHAESIQLCDRVLVLDGGKIVGECLPSDVPDQFALSKLCREKSFTALPHVPAT